MSAPKKLTIRRSGWARGGRGPSALLNAAGTRCCLGFAARDLCGLADNVLRLACLPNSNQTIYEAFRRSVPELVGSSPAPNFINLPPICTTIVQTNDDPELSEPSREAKLTHLFKTIGIDLEFVD